jgi:hypothetical protein
MTLTQGRTSRLKRFLSMPRYFGASRSRSSRGAKTRLAGVRGSRAIPEFSIGGLSGLPKICDGKF